jgi:hypothetical protein
MTLETIDFTKLDAVLEQERTCLLEGDLEALGTLLPVKEQLVDSLLGETELNREVLAPLEDKLHRNQLLLDGALDGIRAVATRLAALRQVRTVLDTYDAQGRKKQVVSPTTPQVEKRA